MKRILIVSRNICLKLDGGTLVSKRNERLFQSIGYLTDRFVIEIPSIMTRAVNLSLFQSYGNTPSLLKQFKQLLKKPYDYIFFDGSIYGGYVKLAHNYGKETICFYHNVEQEYYRQKAKETGSFLDKIMVPYIKFNERLSTKYASKIITLTKRDSDILTTLYGRQADAILPTSFLQKEIGALYKHLDYHIKPYLLFVGSNFFANEEGLRHFIKEIAPKINTDVKIVGNINEAFRNVKDLPSNVIFVGRSDSLDDYYINASAVIAPILSGSGLKTKTAEALSFAKTVIGYEEAFVGIDYNDFPNSCIRCSDSSEFINAINSLDLQSKYNLSSQKLFEERLSDTTQCKILKSIL